MNKYKIIMFDLDGTLFDTSEGVKKTFFYVFNKNNLDIPSNVNIKQFIGPPLYKTFSEYFGYKDEKIFTIISEFRDYYSKNQIFNAKLYPKMSETLAELKNRGYKLTVATNKNEEHAKMILDHFDIMKYFDMVSGSNSSETLEKKDMIFRILEKYQCNNNEAVMIGDAKSDYDGAKIMKVDFIAAIYGFGFSDKNIIKELNIDCFVDEPIELLNKLK